MSELGFNKNHFLIGLSAVVIFGVLVFSKTGVSLSAMFTKADETQPMLTYEQAKGEVYAQMGIIDEDKYLADLENQFALLDRGQVDGAVLGEAIGVGAVPSSEQIFSRELLDQIELNVSNDNSAEAIQKYAEQSLGIEAEANTIVSIASLNSSDVTSLTESKAATNQVIANLSSLTVPSKLADYHRYKMIYYQNMVAMSDSLASNDDSQLLQNQTAIFLSVIEKLEQVKSEILNTYQVQL